ncbi:S8 family peptidase [Spirosoma horti]
MSINLLFSLTFLTWTGYAQKASLQWHHLDPLTDKTIGISTNQAYQLLQTLPKPKARVIVAVIDGGVDRHHEDLKSVSWTNPKEVAGNEKDDDRNGYVDDVHGWNFLGLKDGTTLAFLPKEETRLYARLQPLYATQERNLNEQALLTPAQQRELPLWKLVKPYFESRQAKYKQVYEFDSRILAQDSVAIARLKRVFGRSRIDTASLRHPPTSDTSLVKQAQAFYQNMILRGYANQDIDSYQSGHQRVNNRLKNRINYAYNPQYNPPSIDAKPTDLTEYGYGNADAIGGYTESGTRHGTHVAGIIAADRTNALGVQGIADRVQIMSLVANPDGDERDKDVANAIRYAVDNGAQIINMSFGKYFSPDQAVVDEAIRYAERKGVLLVHVAGNDQLDLDSARMYPTPLFLNGQQAPNLITVGASDRSNDSSLVAEFSNYGGRTVDVFAPGVMIQSTTPKNGYEPNSGTSMATPIVAGIAAVLKTYFPKLTPVEIKRIILQSAVVYHTPVLKPGTRQTVDFASLSRTGGIVNLHEAIKLVLAEQRSTH